MGKACTLHFCCPHPSVLLAGGSFCIKLGHDASKRGVGKHRDLGRRATGKYFPDRINTNKAQYKHDSANNELTGPTRL